LVIGSVLGMDNMNINQSQRIALAVAMISSEKQNSFFTYYLLQISYSEQVTMSLVTGGVNTVSSCFQSVFVGNY